MKFVGHCTTVLQSFKSNFEGITLTLQKLHTLETIALQEAVLCVDFILDFFIMSDIMSHLYPMLHRFLSHVVSFSTSEAVVESWGSVIEHLNKNKPNIKEVIDNLVDTGTIDRLTFIRLNGPPPGLKNNRQMFKTALNLMFKGDYSKHFLHLSGQNLKF